MYDTTMTLGTIGRASNQFLPPQQRTILVHLEAGKNISTQQSMLVYHISRLSDVVLKLRSRGYNIGTRMKEDAVGGKYASYYLVPSPKTVVLREDF